MILKCSIYVNNNLIIKLLYGNNCTIYFIVLSYLLKKTKNKKQIHLLDIII